MFCGRVTFACGLQDEDDRDLDDSLHEEAGDKKKRTKMAAVKGPWAKEEDDVVIRLVGQYGPKRWSLIASNLPGREFYLFRSSFFHHVSCADVQICRRVGYRLISGCESNVSRYHHCQMLRVRS